nr:MAG TPA: hypothetical protein [Caudoviricetes sp.]
MHFFPIRFRFGYISHLGKLSKNMHRFRVWYIKWFRSIVSHMTSRVTFSINSGS